jgi:hypothetical protein
VWAVGVSDDDDNDDDDDMVSQSKWPLYTPQHKHKEASPNIGQRTVSLQVSNFSLPSS